MKFLVCFASLVCATAAYADFVLFGDATEQFTSTDQRDIEYLASQVMPGRHIAAIRCRTTGTGTPDLYSVDVYSEPHEQTPRLWCGAHFKCVRRDKYQPPKASGAVSKQDSEFDLTHRQSGRWIVPRDKSSILEYGVISPPDRLLPSFSGNALAQVPVFDWGRKIRSNDAVDIYDSVLAAAARLPERKRIGLENQSVTYLSVTEKTAVINFGRTRIYLKRIESGWRVRGINDQSTTVPGT